MVGEVALDNLVLNELPRLRHEDMVDAAEMGPIPVGVDDLLNDLAFWRGVEITGQDRRPISHEIEDLLHLGWTERWSESSEVHGCQQDLMPAYACLAPQCPLPVASNPVESAAGPD